MSQPKRVLIVDDHVENVDWAVKLFQAYGHEAKGCYNGRDAIRSVHEYDPDAVIMDISMPDITGWEAARAIRESIPGKRPLLIAVTGEYKGAADLMYSKMSGFDHYILKPADPEKLIELIEA